MKLWFYSYFNWPFKPILMAILTRCSLARWGCHIFNQGFKEMNENPWFPLYQQLVVYVCSCIENSRFHVYISVNNELLTFHRGFYNSKKVSQVKGTSYSVVANAANYCKLGTFLWSRYWPHLVCRIMNPCVNSMLKNQKREGLMNLRRKQVL